MPVRVVDVDAVAPRALLEHDPPPPEHRRLRLAALSVSEEPVRRVAQFQPPAGLQMLQAAVHESRPVSDAVDQHAAVDQVERLRRKLPVALDVRDGEILTNLTRQYLVMVVLLLTSPTGLGRMYFPGSDIVFGYYSGQTRSKI